MKKRMLAILLAGIMAVFLCACGGGETNTETPEETAATGIKVGETWTVEGQWEVTVNSVEEVQERNEFSDKEPGAVYMIDFTYKNIGYEDATGIMDGFYISLDEGQIIDANGVMGYSYPGNIVNFSQETPIGATCNAQSCIGVDNAGPFKITIKKYDSNGEEQTAVFNLETTAG